MQFTHNVQLAEFNFDQVKDLGPGSAAEILSAFDAFPWSEQVAQANQLERCSPTFSVLRTDIDALVWVSAFGEPEKFQFLGEYRHNLGPKKRLFGLLARDEVIHTHFPQDMDLRHARQVLQLFLAGDDAALLELSQ